MTRRLLIILMSMLPIAAGANTFDDVLSEVMSNNLTGRAEAARAEAQTEGILGENTLESPEVEFSRVWNTEAGGENKWSLSVSQSFDWPGVYAARREAARTRGVNSARPAHGGEHSAHRHNLQRPAD